MNTKREVLRAIEDAVSPSCVVTTNTSSFSINRLADVFRRPQRFAGMHFFNPVPSSLLVEVVVSEQTMPEIVEKITGWVAELGKSSITIRDSPGFATSRLGCFSALRQFECSKRVLLARKTLIERWNLVIDIQWVLYGSAILSDWISGSTLPTI